MGTDGHQQRRKTSQRNNMHPQGFQPHAFEQDAPNNRDIMAQGID